MEITKREVVYNGKFIRLVHKHFNNSKQTGVWESIERTTGDKDAVVITAFTPENELILERNWRAGAECFVIQLPAGLNDKPGETEEEAARRELLEETGYLADKLEPIMRAPEAPGLLPTGLSHYIARDVRYVGQENPDAAEQIEVIKVPLPELTDFLLHLPPDTVLDLRVPGLLWIMEKQGMISL